jgi:hypothetical protein
VLRQSIRPLVPVLIAVLLAIPLGPASQVASAVCADPRGPAYCTNDGLVTFPTPVPPSPPTAPCADPRGAAYCSNGGQVSAPNPNPGQANPTTSSIANNTTNSTGAANATTSAAVPVAPGLSVQVNPPAGGVGDTVAVVGQGFSANGSGGLVFINLVDSNGVARDTNYKPITCMNTQDWLLNLYQDLGWGCSGEAAGPLTNSNAGGGFAASFTVPDGVGMGPGKVCVASVFSNPVCTAFVIQAPGSTGDGSPAPDQDPTDDGN